MDADMPDAVPSNFTRLVIYARPLARLEVPVRTALRFTSGPLPLLKAWEEPESVCIEFEGREIGWVVPHHMEGEPEPGPTVTVLLPDDTPEAWGEARELVQRFLSALAFEYDLRIESAARSGGSGEATLLHPYGAVTPRDATGIHLARAPVRIHLDQDGRARLAVAVYREGLCAASPFYRFLAYWNVLEAVHNGDGAKRNAFLGRAALSSPYYAGTAKGDVAEYLRDESRNAVAHVIRDDPTDTSIDPDLPEDRERLDMDGRWLQDLARTAILERWPNVVRTDRRRDDVE